MRIIGEIDHPQYKITVLEMNKKLTIQIEDGLIQQSYLYRDGSGVETYNDAIDLVTEDFIEEITTIFTNMRNIYRLSLEKKANDENLFFEII